MSNENIEEVPYQKIEEEKAKPKPKRRSRKKVVIEDIANASPELLLEPKSPVAKRSRAKKIAPVGDDAEKKVRGRPKKPRKAANLYAMACKSWAQGRRAAGQPANFPKKGTPEFDEVKKIHLQLKSQGPKQ